MRLSFGLAVGVVTDLLTAIGAGDNMALRMQAFPASGTWVVPSNVHTITILAIGAGSGGAGGGGGASVGTGGGGAGTGGNNGIATSTTMPVTPGETLTITVGAGGAGGAAGAAAGAGGVGANGGETIIAGALATITVPGGCAISTNGGATRAGGAGLNAGNGPAGAAASQFTATATILPVSQVSGDNPGQAGGAGTTNATGGGGGAGGSGAAQRGGATYASTAAVPAAAGAGGTPTLYSLAGAAADLLGLFCTDHARHLAARAALAARCRSSGRTAWMPEATGGGGGGGGGGRLLGRCGRGRRQGRQGRERLRGDLLPGGVNVGRDDDHHPESGRACPCDRRDGVRRRRRGYRHREDSRGPVAAARDQRSSSPAPRATVTDDTAAIQATLNALVALGGGTCYFPRGTYKVTASLVIASNGIALRGAGRTSSKILYQGATAAITAVAIAQPPGTTFAGGSGVAYGVFEDLGIDLTGATVGTNGIDLVFGCVYTAFRRLTFTVNANAGNGIVIRGVNPATPLVANGMQFFNVVEEIDDEGVAQPSGSLLCLAGANIADARANANRVSSLSCNLFPIGIRINGAGNSWRGCTFQNAGIAVQLEGNQTNEQRLPGQLLRLPDAGGDPEHHRGRWQRRRGDVDRGRWLGERHGRGGRASAGEWESALLHHRRLSDDSRAARDPPVQERRLHHGAGAGAERAGRQRRRVGQRIRATLRRLA